MCELVFRFGDASSDESILGSTDPRFQVLRVPWREFWLPFVRRGLALYGQGLLEELCGAGKTLGELSRLFSHSVCILSNFFGGGSFGGWLDNRRHAGRVAVVRSGVLEPVFGCGGGSSKWTANRRHSPADSWSDKDALAPPEVEPRNREW